MVAKVLEYGAAYWDPYREGQINALDRVQRKAAKFAHHRNDATWESLTQRKQLAYSLYLKHTRENGRGRL
jgi:predicted ATPase